MTKPTKIEILSSKVSYLESIVNGFRDQANAIALRMVAIEKQMKTQSAPPVFPSVFSMPDRTRPLLDASIEELLAEVRRRY